MGQEHVGVGSGPVGGSEHGLLAAVIPIITIVLKLLTSARTVARCLRTGEISTAQLKGHLASLQLTARREHRVIVRGAPVVRRAEGPAPCSAQIDPSGAVQAAVPANR